MTPPAINMNSTTPTAAETNKPGLARIRVGLGDVTKNNLNQLMRLNKVLFPIDYKPSFYNEILEVGEFAKIIYFNDICVGAVCCRKTNVEGSRTLQDLYIATLGILAPYRQYGLGSKLLKHVLENAELPPSSGPKIARVYLHVQTNNEQALKFYKKHGFEKKERCENYYPQFDESDAYLLEKVLIREN
ncbi:N-alpha-acetyltransferase 50 [Modicella reniformis]|uniref:N-alpha-acetyltransferase 50 n=1 Tax=Modicella reniformis TaxID=1440133 RepID=A0A9P6M2Y9_9FUNG|nr:N-alpha-acetyltransferase 50 [Modicella reniformis]